MPSENVVHIRLEYGEAIKAKRSILSSEKSSLMIEKMLGRYKSLRGAELDLKGKIYTRMKEARANIKKLQVLLPTPKIPRILKRVRTEEKHVTAVKPEYHSEDIESQLREIQKRLEELQG